MKPSANVHWNPDRLDVRAFALAGASVSATEPVTRFARLAADLPEDATPAECFVQWAAQGEMRAGQSGSEPVVWLHLEAKADVPLTCQRCLAPVPIQMSLDRWFRFVADETTAATEDEDSEEDVLSLEPRPNLRDLLEDELLMALPLVPMHDSCTPSMLLGQGEPSDAGDDGEPPRPHPFAQLARLKK